MKRTKVVLCSALLALTAAACQTPGPPGTTTTTRSPDTTLAPGERDCDRACLKGAVDGYLQALVARDPSRLPVAPGVRFTEDNVVRQLGEGLWRTATRVRPYRQDMLDVATGVAGTQAVLEEGTRPVLFAVRLRLVDQRITEIETMVVRNRTEGNNIFSPENLRAPSPAMNVVPPAGQVSSRAEVLQISDSYARGLKAGNFVTSNTPFGPGAYRLENGARMAGPGGLFRDIRNSLPRSNPSLTYRVLGVDEELGIAWLALNFRPTTAGNSLYVWEMFKIYDGEMHVIEAFMKSMPTASVW